MRLQSLTTPDNITLKGQFLKHKHHDTNPNSRVIILFPGNDAVYQDATTTWMMDFLKDNDTPYSFLLFNPRSLGESKNGLANSKNLLLDSETAYQLIKDQLHIPESQIDLYGHSFGGAQALQLKKLHPHTGGKALIDKTFVTLDAMAFHALGNLKAFIKNFGLYLVKKVGWEFNNYEDLKAIKDPVHIFYHKKDTMIPMHCNLGKAVSDKNPSSANISVHAYDNDWGGHFSPLTSSNLVEDPKGRNSKRLLSDIFQHKVSRHRISV